MLDAIAEPRPAGPRATVGERLLDDRLFIAVALACGAGLVHVQAAVDHVQEYALFAAFFALLAAAQFCWGIALYRSPSRRLLLAGATASLAVVGLWIMSRTSGLPIGPSPWNPESVGATDSIATADEIVLVLMVIVHLRGDGAGALARAWRLLVAAAALCLILLSSLTLTLADHVH